MHDSLQFACWLVACLLQILYMRLGEQVHNGVQEKNQTDIEHGQPSQQAHNLARFQTVPQLMYVAAITLASGVLAGTFSNLPVSGADLHARGARIHIVETGYAV